MPEISGTQPSDVRPLAGYAGAPYEPLTQELLEQAALHQAWLVLTMYESLTRVAITRISNIRVVNEGDVVLTFTCQDVNAAWYRGTVTYSYTTFARAY